MVTYMSCSRFAWDLKLSSLILPIQSLDEKINQEQRVQGGNSEKDEFGYKVNHFTNELVVKSAEDRSLKKYEDLRNLIDNTL